MTEHLRIADIARLRGCTPAQISAWRSQSAPGKRFADHPFPAPDGQDGRSPLWNADRVDELTAWEPTTSDGNDPAAAAVGAESAAVQESAPVAPQRPRPLRHY